jgi:hypothetical protein
MLGRSWNFNPSITEELLKSRWTDARGRKYVHYYRDSRVKEWKYVIKFVLPYT